jgi:hypothetical protein
MNNQTFLTILSYVFILLGSYNLLTGFKRIREARVRGISFKWYKQINVLTGIEFILLALATMIVTSIESKSLPSVLRGIAVPLYLILFLAAAILAGLVIRQSIMNTRSIRSKSHSSSPTANSNGTSAISGNVRDGEDAQQRATNLERRRERRHNAAIARRRRAGKA